MPTSTQTPYDLFTFYLKAAHLRDQPRTVTIESAVVMDVFNPGLNKNVPSIVLHFKDARRSLKLNKTQAEAMMQIAGETIVGWAGVQITLTPGKTKSGKETITITSAKEQEK